MAKIKYVIDLGFAGCGDEGEEEIDDGMSKEQIDAYVHDMAQEWAQSWEGDERLYYEWNDEVTEHFYENVYGSWEWAD